MEANKSRERTNWRLCQTHNCSANASTTCSTDGVVVCNIWTAIFHYDWDVNIKDGKGFIKHALETLKHLVKIMKDIGMETRIDTNNFVISCDLFKLIRNYLFTLLLIFKFYFN